MQKKSKWKRQHRGRQEEMTRNVIVTSIVSAAIIFAILFVSTVSSLATEIPVTETTENTLLEEETVETEVEAPKSEDISTSVEVSLMNTGMIMSQITIEKVETENRGPGVNRPENNMEDYRATVYVASREGLNIRSEPNTDAEILGSYNFRDTIDILKRGDGWLYTQDGNFVYENGTSLEEPQNIKSLGTFKLTAYCTCSKCCGKNAKYGITRSGTRPVEGRTISVDPNVIPLGSKVIIDGHEYIAEDTGSAIKNNIIDLFIDGHQRARQFGVQYKEVFVYTN